MFKRKKCRSEKDEKVPKERSERKKKKPRKTTLKVRIIARKGIKEHDKKGDKRKKPLKREKKTKKQQEN